jgi:hypothetical protein
VSQSLQLFLRNKDIDTDALGVWALAKPCQVAALAKLAAEPTTEIGLAFCLAGVREFVEALIELKPLVFEGFPDRISANRSCHSLQDLLTDCFVIVSSFKLRRRSLPASAVQLIKETVSFTAESSDEQPLRELYQLLSVVPGHVLEFFNEESLAALSLRCKEISSRSSDRETIFEMMLSQAIMAQLAFAFQTPQTPSKSSLETPPGAKFSETCRKRVYKLFSDPLAVTTLKVTLLRLCLLCTDSPDLALDGMDLTKTIIKPISMLVRQQFLEKSMVLIEKLLSRSAGNKCGLKVRLEVSPAIHHFIFRC